MIIRWTLEESFDVAVADPGFLTSVGELLRASRLGHHLVVVERSVVARLMNLDVGEANRAQLQRLHQEYTQTGRLHEIATAFIQVTTKKIPEPEIQGSAVFFPISDLVTSKILDEPALLVENIEFDGWLYSEIIKAAARDSGRGQVAINLVHGGGTDTPRVLKSLIDDKRIACVLIDSDRDCPTSTECSTLKKVRKQVDSAAWSLAKVFSPPCRELENVLPVELVMQISSAIGNPENSRLLDISDKERRDAHPPEDKYWSYFDIKLGQSQERLEKLAVEAKQWHTEKLEKGGPLKDGWKIPGYGENVISQIKADGSLISEMRRLFATSHWKAVFWGFFGFLAWFFVSAPKRIT